MRLPERRHTGGWLRGLAAAAFAAVCGCAAPCLYQGTGSLVYAETGHRPPSDVLPALTSGTEETAEGEEIEIHLWPLVESTRLPSGARRTSFAGVFHRTVLPSGKVYSWHAGPYAQGPGYNVLFPLFYRIGPKGAKHTGFFPLYHQGPDYRIAPPLLMGKWRRADGSTSAWLTPLSHVTREKDGSFRNMHLFTYYKDRQRTVLFPLFVAGRDNFYCPPLLSFWRRYEDGSSTAVITPLFHITKDPEGKVQSLHALNWFQGPNYKILFPLFYRRTQIFEGYFQGRETHTGIIPLAFWGPGYCVVPPLLSWRFNDLYTGRDQLWLTPLFHRTTDNKGRVIDWHFGPYLSGPGYRVLFPFYYRFGEGPGRHWGVVPFFGRGPGYWCVPPLLSAGWQDPEGGRHLWVTPLYHHRTDADGAVLDQHLLTYFRGPGYAMFPPFYFRRGSGEDRHSALVPFYFRGPTYEVVPPLLMGRWKHFDGSRSAWLGPFAHSAVDTEGNLKHMHIFNYYHSPELETLFPLYFRIGSGQDRQLYVLPFFLRGPGFRAVPPLLSGWWERKDGSSTAWITPLYHHTKTADGKIHSRHCLNYFETPTLSALFPFWYRYRRDGIDQHAVLPPLYFAGKDYRVAPLLLSGWWKHPDDRRTLLITPLYHRTGNADGSLHNMHLLTYFKGTDYNVLFPLWYKVGPDESEHFGLLPPLYVSGPNYRAVPPLISGWRRDSDGAQTWLGTPLFHITREADGSLRSMHFANYFQGGNYKVLFPIAHSSGPPGEKHQAVLPFWMRGPDYVAVPPFVAGKFRRRDGSVMTCLTPLFHRTSEPDGSLRSMHAFNFFWGKDSWCLFPLAYAAGPKEKRYRGFVPLYFSGPDYDIVPPLLTGRWKNPDGSRSAWLTPMFHRTDEPDGSFRNMHAFVYYQDERLKTLFPVFWNWKEEDGSRRTLVPFLFTQHRAPSGDVSRSVVPPLFLYRRSTELDTSLSMQLHPILHQRAGEDFEFNFLWRLYSIRRQSGATRVVVGPLWWSRRPAAHLPMQFQVLGGLFARDCNYRKGTYRYRILWLIPAGPRRRFFVQRPEAPLPD